MDEIYSMEQKLQFVAEQIEGKKPGVVTPADVTFILLLEQRALLKKQVDLTVRQNELLELLKEQKRKTVVLQKPEPDKKQKQKTWFGKILKN